MASTEFNIKTASRLYYGGYYDRLVEAREALELLFGEMEYELLNKNGRNPIEYIKARIKTPASMEEKLARLNKDGLRLGAQDLFDGCGTRLVCTFIDDCYTIKSWLAARRALILVAEKDYIRHPKPSGYRSYPCRSGCARKSANGSMRKFKSVPFQWTAGPPWNIICATKSTS